VALVALGLYAVWPKLTGQAEAGDRDPVEGETNRRAQVQVVVLEPGDFVLRAEATGHLTPWRATDLSPEGTGIVRERPVEEGQFVREGDLLLQLDDREQRIALSEAESDLLKAQTEFAALTVVRSSVAVDTTRAHEALVAYRKAVDGHAEGTVTDAALERARRDYEIAVVRSGGRRADVEAVVTGLAQAEDRAERARLELSRTRLIAPFAGHIADLEVEVGQRVGPGSIVMRLLDDTRMKVDVSVLEGDLVGIERGATARVRIPALGDSVLSGRVFSINPSVDPTSGTGRVTVSLDNPRGELVAGLFAYVELETGRLPNRLVVPAESVLRRQGRDLVFVVGGGRAAWTYVTVGRRSGDLVEIVEPLSAGDSVAVAGHHALAHDAAVQVTGVVGVER
jgi:HlyD family secretion protein